MNGITVRFQSVHKIREGMITERGSWRGRSDPHSCLYYKLLLQMPFGKQVDIYHYTVYNRIKMFLGFNKKCKL